MIIIKSTEDFVKEFPAAKQFIENNNGYFQELALEYETETLFLQHIISSFLKEMNLHFFVFATPTDVIIFELNFDNILINGNEVKVMAGKKHLEHYYTNLVFEKYKFHPMVKAISQKNYTYEMAIDINNKIGSADLKVIG